MITEVFAMKQDILTILLPETGTHSLDNISEFSWTTVSWVKPQVEFITGTD